jgi:hypothetical protein
MDRGGLDSRNLEGFSPFQCSSLPDRDQELEGARNIKL